MIVSPLAAPTSPGEERQQRLDSGLEVAPERGVAALRQYLQPCSGDRDRPGRADAMGC
jgi:hypothetical protein